MYLSQAIACSGIGALCLFHYYRSGGESVLFLILGIVNLIYGSMNAKKHQEHKNKD